MISSRSVTSEYVPINKNFCALHFESWEEEEGGVWISYEEELGEEFKIEKEIQNLFMYTQNILNTNTAIQFGNSQGCTFMHEMALNANLIVILGVGSISSSTPLDVIGADFGDIISNTLSLLREFHYWLEETSTIIFSPSCSLSLFKVCMLVDPLSDMFPKSSNNLQEIGIIGTSIIKQLSERSGYGEIFLHILSSST